MKGRLLILDDEARMVDILTMVLRREGYDVTPCTESSLALEQLAAEPFDLLITDLRMPGRDGLEVLRAARVESPELSVILMTAHASVATAIEQVVLFDALADRPENPEIKLPADEGSDGQRLVA